MILMMRRGVPTSVSHHHCHHPLVPGDTLSEYFRTKALPASFCIAHSMNGPRSCLRSAQSQVIGLGMGEELPVRSSLGLMMSAKPTFLRHSRQTDQRDPQDGTEATLGAG